MAINRYTFRDFMEQLWDSELSATSSHRPTLKRAVREAYRQLLSQYNWRYFYAEHYINLEGSYQTGTVVYTHTGGAHERVATLTGGTWPSWAASGRMSFNNAIYEVDTREDDDEITLDDVLNPGADVASTSYVLYQNTYPLPDDFRRMDQLISTNDWFGKRYIEPEEWMGYERFIGNLGEPFYWTIMGSNEPGRQGLMDMRLAGYPASDTPVSFIYRRAPQPPNLSGYETKATAGTVECTADDPTITGTNTTFDASMVGEVIRIDSGTTTPTSHDGTNPPAEEHVIKSVTNATTLVMETDATQSLAAGRAYVVSSLMDIRDTMINALSECARWKLASGGTNIKVAELKRMDYERELLLAQGQDNSILMQRAALGPSAQRHFFYGNPRNTS